MKNEIAELKATIARLTAENEQLRAQFEELMELVEGDVDEALNAALN